jgi:hypothetical protein
MWSARRPPARPPSAQGQSDGRTEPVDVLLANGRIARRKVPFRAQMADIVPCPPSRIDRLLLRRGPIILGEPPPDELEAEIYELEVTALVSSYGLGNRSRRLRQAHYVLGVPATALAATAAAGAFAEGRAVVAGGCAVVAAGLTALMTFVRPGARAERLRLKQAAFLDLGMRARRLRRYQLARLPENEAVPRVDDLAEELQQLLRTEQQRAG